MSFFFQLTFVALNFGITLMLLWLIAALSDETTQYWMAWMYASILIACTFLGSFFRTHSLLQMALASVGIRNQLMTAGKCEGPALTLVVS